MQSSICHNNKREKLTPEFSDINTACWLPKIKESKNFAAVLYPLDITLKLHCIAHVYTGDFQLETNHKDPIHNTDFHGDETNFFCQQKIEN